MGAPAQSEVTRILAGLSEGDPGAASRLLPLVYEELRSLAHRRLRNEPPGLTLQATALVHEAYMRLVGDENLRWDNRGHFFGAAAEAMRRILVERARRYGRKKHGGGRRRVPLEHVERADPQEAGDDLVALDEALRKLEARDPLRSQVIKLRYFAGLTIEQTAEVMGVSPATVSGHWTYARAWLYQAIREGEATGPRESD
jgi:RNA polymerase sigma factor (TIGR02999 family)